MDEVKALYAPRDHPVFELVPCLLHDHVDSLYTAIGWLEITIHTFWDIFLDLLKWLHDTSDKILTDILSTHQQTSARPDDDMPLLLNMAPFCLGQPLDVGGSNYIGEIDVSVLPSSVPVPCPEYACFTSDEDSGDDEDGLSD